MVLAGMLLQTSTSGQVPFPLGNVVSSAGHSCRTLAEVPENGTAVQHPTPRTPQSLGTFLASRLADIGVGHIFNVPGDFSLILLDQLMLEPRIQLVQCCNELNAGYAADGYARTKGVGCICVTFGVGTLSTINAIAGAYAENLPVVVIAGNPPTSVLGSNKLIHHTIGRGNFNFEINCMKPVTCYQAQINHAETAYGEINHALIMALTHRKPVYISIASNLAAAHHPSLDKEPLPFRVPKQVSESSVLNAAVRHTAAFFEGAVKPVIVAGAHLRSPRAQAALVKLAEATGLPVAVAPNAKGFFPENHMNYIGVFWVNISSPFTGETVTIADKYLFAGPMFNDVTTVGFTHPIVKDRLVDIQSDHVSIGTEGHYGSVLLEDFLEALIPAMPRNNKALLNWKAMYVPPGLPAAQAPNTPILTKVAYKHIQAMLKPNHVAVVDAGDSWFNAVKLRLPGGAKFEIQMQYASIGWSVGATLGICAALKDVEEGLLRKRPVLFCGDGAFQMSAQELSTIVRYNFSPIIFILNNGGYTVEIEIHDGPYNVINNWNYSKLLEVFDPEGSRTWSKQVRTEEEMEQAIAMATDEDMIHHTCLIEVILDKDDCSRELLEFGARLSFQATNQGAIVQ